MSFEMPPPLLNLKMPPGKVKNKSEQYKTLVFVHFDLFQGAFWSLKCPLFMIKMTPGNLQNGPFRKLKTPSYLIPKII